MSTVAALAAGLAVWLAFAAPPRRRLAPPRPPTAAARSWLAAWPMAAGLAVGAAVALWFGPLVGLAAALPAATVCWIARRQRLRFVTLRRRSRIESACRMIAGTLRVGRLPGEALRLAAKDCPEFARAAGVEQLGGDIPAALRAQGGLPGGEALVDLAAAWELAQRTGASLTVTLDMLSRQLAEQVEVRQVVSSELSAPRSTGRLLAALPVAGIGLGYMMGGDPLEFLIGSAAGQFVLLAGVVLACAGVVWTERIADD
ncbi:MAG: hypothetical protein LBR32_09115 [Propionibacteriaceae bacterium]|jgi:tight adherence protein B|nr:hypothetical protein [Propionibacteriaceae bacterium]